MDVDKFVENLKLLRPDRNFVWLLVFYMCAECLWYIVWMIDAAFFFFLFLFFIFVCLALFLQETRPSRLSSGHVKGLC